MTADTAPAPWPPDLLPALQEAANLGPLRLIRAGRRLVATDGTLLLKVSTPGEPPDTLQAEIDAALRAYRASLDVIPPSSTTLSGHHTSFLSFWPYLPPERDPDSDDLTALATTLASLHTLEPVTSADPVEVLEPQLRTWLDHDSPNRQLADRLADRFHTTRSAWQEEVSGRRQVLLHGDAAPSNILVFAGRVRLFDLEHTAAAPAEWDLGSLHHSLVSLRGDQGVYTRVAAAYTAAAGRPLDDGLVTAASQVKQVVGAAFTYNAAHTLQRPDLFDEVWTRLRLLDDPAATRTYPAQTV